MVAVAAPLLSEVERRRVAGAVRDAEKNTSGEIYCVLAQSSDGYFWASAFVLAASMLLCSLVLALLLEYWWIMVRPVQFAAAQILALGAALVILRAFPALRIHLVPRSLRYRRAHHNARRQFLAHNIHVTEARTGVLLFISLAERYAEVIADAGIASQVPQQTWNGMVEILTRHAHERRLAEGLVIAIGEAGALLSLHFPAQPHDRNELDDHIVEI